MVFTTTFNNITSISWRSVLLVEETGVPEVCTTRFWNNVYNSRFHAHDQKMENPNNWTVFWTKKPSGMLYLMLIFLEWSSLRMDNYLSRKTFICRHTTHNLLLSSLILYKILQLKDTTNTARSASYVDLHLDIDNERRFLTKHYVKRDEICFPIYMQ